MTEWKKTKLDSYASINMGQSPESKYYNKCGNGLPFLQGNRTFGKKYPSIDTWTIKTTKVANVGEVLMSVRAPVGDINMATEALCLGRGVCSITCNDSNNEFLYYLLKYRVSDLISNEIGSVFGSVNKEIIGNLPIELPDETTRYKIGRLLSDLDHYIEINMTINDYLEAICTETYHELFSSFNYSGKLSDIGDIVGGSTPSKAHPEYYSDNGIAWLTPKDLSINKNKYIHHGENDISVDGMNNSSLKMMPRGTVLFSSRAPIGYIAIASDDVTTNQGFKSVVPKNEVGTAFVYHFLKDNLDIIKSQASGSTFMEVSGSLMKNIDAILPDAVFIEKFKSIVNPIMKLQEYLEQENNFLCEFRNNMLPKLISGEIDVSNSDVDI